MEIVHTAASMPSVCLSAQNYSTGPSPAILLLIPPWRVAFGKPQHPVVNKPVECTGLLLLGLSPSVLVLTE